MAVKKEDLSKMIELLSDRDLPLVYNMLARLIDKQEKQIPYDTELLTEDDLEAIKEAEEDYKQKRTIPFEDLDHEI
ncbi:MAG: hypothetical protein LRY73_07630 [Bacillus sp. (in: Bacteria)]|nr:hypothetical protein [Bacillus sp. (in: firmicutes)]